MQPFLYPRDIVIGTRLFNRHIKKNNVIIFFDKNYSYIIKRVLYREANLYTLVNDNKNVSSIFCNKPIYINNNVYRIFFKIRLSKVRIFFNFSFPLLFY